jgi:hypothetical protein
VRVLLLWLDLHFDGLSKGSCCVWRDVVLEDMSRVRTESPLSTSRVREVSDLNKLGSQLVCALLHAADSNIKGLTQRKLSVVQDAGFGSLRFTVPGCVCTASWSLHLGIVGDINIRI